MHWIIKEPKDQKQTIEISPKITFFVSTTQYTKMTTHITLFNYISAVQRKCGNSVYCMHVKSAKPNLEMFSIPFQCCVKGQKKPTPEMINEGEHMIEVAPRISPSHIHHLL